MVEWFIPLTDLGVIALLLVIGGNLGSFLNVVVYRLPRGESVVHGGSHCPSCGSAIRWHDNVPVLGWLLLGGRCRDCGAMIAARYPLVEAVGAVVIGGVAAAELLSGGRTLPGGACGVVRPGADNLLLRPDPLLIAVAVLHAWLLFNLLLGAAVETDGRVVPARWSRTALGITLAIVVGWNALLPVGIGIEAPAWMGRGPWRGLSIAACGLACGTLLGVFSTPAGRQGLMLIGVGLGWQAAATVAVLRPAIGWLRTLLASLVPLNPPDVGGRGAVFGAETTSESVLSGLASPALEPWRPIDPGVSLLPEAGPAPAVDPETDPDQRSFVSRLAEPIVLQLRQIEFPGGDLLVATAAFLLVWGWLWRGVAA
jgi:leader peptidase (prepilin peptidase)/N-methyltransferase